MQRDCHVTLYQNAHAYEGMPQFKDLIGPDGVKFEPAACWKEVYETIMKAEYTICITGWAVWDKLQLFRGRDLNIDNRTLGELLIEKANSGVQVGTQCAYWYVCTHLKLLTCSVDSSLGLRDGLVREDIWRDPRLQRNDGHT